MRKFLIIIMLAVSSSLYAGESYAYLQGDSLFVVGNSLIERTFVWNGGNLQTLRLVDKTCGHTFETASLKADFVFTQKPDKAGSRATLNVTRVPSSSLHGEYLKATVEYTLDGVDIRREFRIYDNVPAIACDNFLRLHAQDVVLQVAGGASETSSADRKNIEAAADMKVEQSAAPALDRLSLAGVHWHARAVEFTDVTDWNNNLVWTRDIIAYRKLGYRGNILFVRDGVSGSGFYFLKEAPCSAVQLNYNRSDFTADFGTFTVTGAGICADDLKPQAWTRAYGSTVGVYGPSELQALTSLRLYQKEIRKPQDGRDNMVMMNTWGDRSQDTKVNEAFCLAELEKAARLGITHFQIDDGWQEGKSPNSAVAKGSFKNIWANPDYWKPSFAKYPNGLTPIVEKAAQLGLQVGLWYNPSVQNDFEDWRKDADAILSLYRQYGVRVFKIDGLTIPTKKAEENLRRLFDTVLRESQDSVLFNLDATASRRGGYNMFNEYGNIFLENRYTDWQNYYPYQTLRNLWQLSRYIPAERLQIEFLNKWRNTEKYAGDPFGPANYSFEYLFATTMAAEPLAWMEASNLPEEAYSIASAVRRYTEIASDLHSGVILPVGEEPSGRSWTGFQSILSEREGYLIVYREDNTFPSCNLATWLPAGRRVQLIKVLGEGAAKVSAKVDADGSLKLNLPEKNSYALYKYIVK